MSDNVGLFFDALSDGYAEAIKRCFPRYREMLWALVDYRATLPTAAMPHYDFRFCSMAEVDEADRKQLAQ